MQNQSILDISQARNQLGTPGREKSFLRGGYIFETMSNSFKICPKHFSRGAENFLGGLLTSVNIKKDTEE